MENEKKELMKADIRYKLTPTGFFASIIYIAVIVFILIGGFFVGESEIERFNRWFEECGDLDGKIKYLFIGWAGIRLIWYSRHWYDKEGELSIHWGSCILFFIILILLICVPFLIHNLYKRQCKASSLTVTESGLYGSYMSKFKQVSLEMPIEKIDNVMILSGFWDKIRSGKTLSINSASGTIRMHFVQNADEVVAAAMKCIEEHKQSEKQTAAVVQSAPAASIMDKMKELTAMKDAGLITEEELAAKKAELLSKM